MADLIPGFIALLCRERIERAIEVGREAEKFGTPPSQAISLMERAGTIEALPVSTARGSIDLTRAHTHSPIREVTHEVCHMLGAVFMTAYIMHMTHGVCHILRALPHRCIMHQRCDARVISQNLSCHHCKHT